MLLENQDLPYNSTSLNFSDRRDCSIIFANGYWWACEAKIQGPIFVTPGITMLQFWLLNIWCSFRLTSIDYAPWHHRSLSPPAVHKDSTCAAYFSEKPPLLTCLSWYGMVRPWKPSITFTPPLVYGLEWNFLFNNLVSFPLVACYLFVQSLEMEI